MLVGFLYTKVSRVWSELRKHLVFKNALLPSLPRASIVNLMGGSTEYKWLKTVSICSFFNYADNVICISFPPRGRYGAFWA